MPLLPRVRLVIIEHTALFLMVREDLHFVGYRAGAAERLLLVNNDGARVGGRETFLGADHVLRQELAEVSSLGHVCTWR